MRIRTSGLNRLGAFRRDPRIALPLLAAASSRMEIDADVVIASSSGWRRLPDHGEEDRVLPFACPLALPAR